MATPLFVGIQEVIVGVVYPGFVPLGNAFRLTEPAKFSINNSVFGHLPVNEDIFALSQFSYVCDRDTTVILSRVVTSDLSIVYNSQCPNDVALIQDIESAIICSVISVEDVTTGKISTFVNINNSNNQPVTVTQRIYSNFILVDTEVYNIPASTSQSKGKQISIITPILATQTVHFTLESSATGVSVDTVGGSLPSQVQIERIT